MKKIILIAYVCLGTLGNLTAQCPGCVIDPTCAVGINPVAPTQCPLVLPNATQGVYYDQDVTFYMPRNFDVTQPISTSVQLNSLTVTGFTGMPQGLNFTCNQPNCAFTITNDPLSERGCAKICGTPTIPGNYTVLVSVVANVSASGQTLNQPQTITLPIVVESTPGGNCCYSFNPPSACGSLSVTYQALIDLSPDQPTTYSWTFDNGNTSTQKNPPVQTYTQPGQHFPRLVTTVNNYVLTDISVTASGTNWCGDVEEISLFGACQGAPDIYYIFTNGATSAQGTFVSNNTVASWSGLNLVLTNPVMSLQFWDDDGTSQDDNLGVAPVNVTGAGTFNFTTTVNGNQETFGTYTIALQVDTTFDTTDTVEVFALPPLPIVTSTPNDSACFGDSILLATAAGPYSYQWFSINTLISDSIATYVSTTGYYRVTVVDTNTICSATSDSSFYAIVNYPQAPVIVVNSTTNELQLTNNSANFDVTWSNNGVIIPNENSNTLGGQTSSGPYTATFSNPIGCSTESFPFTLCLSGTAFGPPNDTLCCGELQEYLAQGFVTSPGFITAWAVTPSSFGPVNDAQSATNANNAGYVFLPTGQDSLSFTRSCFTYADSIVDGDYYVTPFIVEAVDVPAPVVWDTLIGCRPYAFMCPILSGQDGWSLNPMVFTFPDGSQLNVNVSVAAGLNITQALINSLPGQVLPCINLMNLFNGNPNGPWSISATNNGTGELQVDVPAFQVINYVDSCPLITQNQVYTIDAISLTIQPGQTATVDINIPPIPGGFPSIQAACSGFGEAHLVHYTNCYPDATCTLTVDSVQAVNVSTTGGTNGFADVSISGGTPPYSINWNNGSSNEDLFNVPAGVYRLVVSDANGCKDSLRIMISQPPSGMDEVTGNGFNLLQNQPNPAFGFTDISFWCQEANTYQINISTLEGKTIVTENFKAKSGLNTYHLDTKSFASGVYFYAVKGKVSSANRKMIIQK